MKELCNIFAARFLQAQNVEAERKATEIRLRAERRTGELLAAMQRADAPNAQGKNQHEVISHGATQPTSEYAAALESTGISRQQAHRYQELAGVPKEKFEQHLSDPDSKPTTSGIIRAANGSKRMDNNALKLWGVLRDFERDGLLPINPQTLYAGMTETMQADVRRVLPTIIDWLNELKEVVK